MPNSARHGRALGAALGGVLVTALAAILPAAQAPAHADATTITPILNGGEVHWAGTATRTYDGASDDGYTNSTDHASSTISWDTRMLLAGHYPDDPITPIGDGGNGLVVATDYDTVLDSATPATEHQTEACDAPDPDCQANLDYTSRDCSWKEISNGPGAFVDDNLGRQWAVQSFGIDVHGNLPQSNYTCGAAGDLYDPTMWARCDEIADDATDACGTVVDFPLDPLEGAGATITKNVNLANPTVEPDCGRSDDTSSCTQSGHSTLTVGCALCVTAISFEQANIDRGGQHAVPDFGTVDGNIVRVTATVHNQTAHAITAPVRFRDLTVDKDLALAKDGLKPAASVQFPAGADTTVAFDWDTDGFAWYPPHTADPHKIAVLTPYGGARRDLSVRPKPVLLVHGWNSDASTWDGYPDNFSHVRTDWIAQAVVGMNTDPGTGWTLDHNARVLAFAVGKMRAKYDAAHIDLVAHSMGGLISRDYLQYLAPDVADHKPAIAHLVMLGTPNMGSRCAYLAYLAGQTGDPTFELSPTFIEGTFNHQVTDRRGTKFSVLAGIAKVGWLNQFESRVLCDLQTPNDLVVWRTSAFWTIADHAEQSGLVHLDMTSDTTAFRTFVAPHLEVTPGGSGTAARLQNRRVAAPVAPASDPVPDVALARTVTIAGRQTVRIALPVSSGTAVGALLVGPAGVTARLLDPHGKQTAIVSTGGGFRAIAAKVTRHGRWTVELRNAGTNTATVGIAARVAGDRFKLTPSVKQKAHHVLALTVKVGGAGKHVKVTARVRAPSRTARAKSIRLRAHGSRWTGTTKALPAGTLITVKVKGSQGTRTALVAVP